MTIFPAAGNRSCHPERSRLASWA